MKELKATARARANIALTKYWGKRSEDLMLPYNSSVSVTLKEFYATTTVSFSKEYKNDSFMLNKKNAKEKELKKILNPLNKIRKLAKLKMRAKIVSENNFPTAAGLSSSSAGLAAFALAASKAAGLNLSSKQLSVIARLGSGSATRSVLGGFVEWKKGTKKNGSDSIAVQVLPENKWKNFRMLTTIITTKRKKISSTSAMKQTVKTCPFYKAWLNTIDADIRRIRKAIKEKSIEKVGEIAEHNCLKMHSLMMTTKPAIIYWQPSTLEIMHSVIQLRENSVPCYFTIDAGPNVKVVCEKKHEKKIKENLLKLKGVKKVVSCSPGKGVELLEKHLF